jgi:hypothetical protein
MDSSSDAGKTSGIPAYEYVISNASKIAGEDGFLEQLEKALKKLDIRMYDIPSTNNTDTYGYIFSKDQLSDSQISKIDKQLAGNDEMPVGGSDENEELVEKPVDNNDIVKPEDDEDFKIT